MAVDTGTPWHCAVGIAAATSALTPRDGSATLQAMRKLLFTKSSPALQPLRAQVARQDHLTLVLWALDCATRFRDLFEAQFPDDARPRALIETAHRWARGEIKMPIARRAIYAAHDAATEAQGSPAAQAAARAVAHAAATIHVRTHALGVVLYGLTALVYAEPSADPDALAARECEWFADRLRYWEAHAAELDGPWAPFLLKDRKPAQ